MAVIGDFLEQARAQITAAGTAAVTQHALDLANSRARLFGAAAAIRASQPAGGGSLPSSTRATGPGPADSGGALASIPKPVLIGGAAALGLIVLIAIAKGRKKKKNPRRHFRARARRRRRSRR